MKNIVVSGDFGDFTNFEDYIKSVEQYLAYEDPETKFMDGLRQRISHRGFPALTEPEQIFYSLNLALATSYDDVTDEFLNREDVAMFEVVSHALSIAGPAELVDQYNELLDRCRAGKVSEEKLIDLCGELFGEWYPEICAAIDQYAIDQQLFDAQ